ncbi:hypothetical protein T492DRAFT_992719 [Pavlovales sp. CCMP2436]|nr:hypothetical protein T492DRAFT_992719 [Pavlovales sp. CCMP2436]
MQSLIDGVIETADMELTQLQIEPGKVQFSIDGVVETADMEPTQSQIEPGKQSSSSIDGVVETADTEPTQSAQIEPGKVLQASIDGVVDMQSSIDGVVETADTEPTQSAQIEPGKVLQASIDGVVDMQSSIDGVVETADTEPTQSAQIEPGKVLQASIDGVVDMQSSIDGVVETSDIEPTQSAEIEPTQSAQIEAGKKVLVLCATGRVGKNVCLALKEAGFDVYGTSRSASAILVSMGVTSVLANYTVRTDLDRALAETGCKRMVCITDFFLAAGNSAQKEEAQGKDMFAAAKAAGVEHLIFISVIDADLFPKEVTHLVSKPILEKFLKEKAGVPFSILRPGCFFEDLNEPSNYPNPLVKGKLSYLSKCENGWPMTATYDIGRAAARQLLQPDVWLGRTMDVVSWKGTLAEMALALEKVGGVPVKAGLAMSLLARRFFLNDLHQMCLYFDAGKVKATVAQFKEEVPDAFSAEDWFRHAKYANGQPIVPDVVPGVH